jgi:hypothetical protein
MVAAVATILWPAVGAAGLSVRGPHGGEPKPWLAAASEPDDAELVLMVVDPLGSNAEPRRELARGEPLILRCVESTTAGQDLCDPLGKVIQSVRFR